MVAFGGSSPHDLGSKPSELALSWINGSGEVCKWIRFGGFSSFSACRAIRSVEDGNTSKRGTELQRVIEQTGNDVSMKLQKDLSSLPSGLSFCSLSDLWILLSFELSNL